VNRRISEKNEELMTNRHLPLEKICSNCIYYRLRPFENPKGGAAYCAYWKQFFPDQGPHNPPGLRVCKHWERTDFKSLYKEG